MFIVGLHDSRRPSRGLGCGLPRHTRAPAGAGRHHVHRLRVINACAACPVARQRGARAGPPGLRGDPGRALRTIRERGGRARQGGCVPVREPRRAARGRARRGRGAGRRGRRRRDAGRCAPNPGGGGQGRAVDGARPDDDLADPPAARASRIALVARAARRGVAQRGDARRARQLVACRARTRLAGARRPAGDDRHAYRGRLASFGTQAVHHRHPRPELAERLGAHR